MYVGQAIDICRRLLTYFEPNGNPYQIRLKGSFAKHGIESHKFEIIEECAIESLNERERHWQDFYKVLSKQGLNCKLTMTNDKSGTLSDITKGKISSSMKGTLKTCKTIMKPVLQYDSNNQLIKEFVSARQASRELNIDCGSISKCCNGKGYYKTINGFTFKYKDNGK